MKFVAATRIRKLQWWQFRLRSMFVVVTLVCVALSVYGWQQARQRYLERSVTSFNALFDAQRYSEARILAKHAYNRYPTPLTESMVEKAGIACQLADNASLGRTIQGCMVWFSPEMTDETTGANPWQLSDEKVWEELALRRKNSRASQ